MLQRAYHEKRVSTSSVSLFTTRSLPTASLLLHAWPGDACSWSRHASGTSVTSIKSNSMSPTALPVSMFTGMAPEACGFTWYTVIFCACAGSMRGDDDARSATSAFSMMKGDTARGPRIGKARRDERSSPPPAASCG